METEKETRQKYTIHFNLEAVHSILSVLFFCFCVYDGWKFIPYKLIIKTNPNWVNRVLFALCQFHK